MPGLAEVLVAKEELNELPGRVNLLRCGNLVHHFLALARLVAERKPLRQSFPHCVDCSIWIFSYFVVSGAVEN